MAVVQVLVVNAGKKATSSTSGMQRTVETSALMNHRATTVVPLRMEAIKKVLLAP